MTAMSMVKLARTVGLKVAFVAYDDEDNDNKTGPVSSGVFVECWERLDCPKDYWNFRGKK